ncbi:MULTISPECIES: Ig-like domain-containing protein [unclassified Microbacterium]|uniref:Ig-like domain-containing protein n=1 Tax=unclassified Microbacterium TaxID=2609290 RepID=UPI0021576809|nr:MULTISPECIES: Ig-like domain-containing protein [unclassified Microbacterium]
MSTDDERPEVPAVPQTRAEMRAAREAAEAAEAERIARAAAPADQAAPPAEQPDADAPAADEAAVREAAVREAAAREAAVREAGDREVAEQEAAARKMAAFEVAAREDVEATTLPPVPVAPEPVFVGAAPVAEAEAEAAPTDEAYAPPAPRLRSEEQSTGKPVRSRRFVLTLVAVLGVLVVVGTGLGIASLLQGPRISNVQVDAKQAIESSGSRAILTANQALADIDPSQVTVEPAVPFTVDASGRGIGVRFTVPLDDSTTYTIRVADVVGAGGGPTTTLTTSFETPASNIFLLRRDVDGKDKIFLTDLSGEKAVPVFEHAKINDFRATSTQLVVSVEEDDGSRLLVMDRDGKKQRELKLPGDGYVGAIQVSERGGLVGYSYSDKELSDTEGRASVLVTQSLSGDDDPQIIDVAGAEASVFVWQFVPDSAAVLFIDFDGALSLVDRSSDAGVQSLGLAAMIQGISRGTYTAIIERLDGTVVELNLADGSEEPLAASDPDYGSATSITPFPGGTLRHVVARDESGLPIGQAVVRVDDDGKATPLVEVSSADSILQACASPSGQYAAVVVAPDLANNPYDGMLLPLPEKVETHLIDMVSGEEIVALTGFDASWCQTAPRF